MRKSPTVDGQDLAMRFLPTHPIQNSPHATIARSLYLPPPLFVVLTSPRRPIARSSIPIHPLPTQPRPATQAILFPINLGIRPGITIFAATIPQHGGLTDTGSGGGMVDTKDLKSFGHLAVRVQVPPGVRNSKTTLCGCLAVFLIHTDTKHSDNRITGHRERLRPLTIFPGRTPL